MLVVKYVAFLSVTLHFPRQQRFLRLLTSNKALQARTVYERTAAEKVERRMKSSDLFVGRERISVLQIVCVM